MKTALIILVVLASIEVTTLLVLSSMVGLIYTLAWVGTSAFFGWRVLRVNRMSSGIVIDARTQLIRGDEPAYSLLLQITRVFGGIFLLIPGLTTDVLGGLLLVTPLRTLLPSWIFSKLPKYKWGPNMSAPDRNQSRSDLEP